MTKLILALILAVAFFSSFAQENVKYYRLDELKNASVDSVFAIDLKKMNLSEIPEEVFKFKNITHLDLSKNKFVTVNGLEHFNKLTYLNLEKNKLDYFPIEICQLINIKTIIINRNYIETIPPCIDQCQNLEMIDLWYTGVTMLPEEMMRISTLKHIDLTGVQINAGKQQKLRNMFPDIKLIMSPPCNCTQ